MKRVLSLLVIIAILFQSTMPAHGGLSSVAHDNKSGSIQLFSISNDYYSDAQTSLNSENEIDIDAPEGWDLYKTLPKKWKPVIVAVIDTGVDYMHEDLANKMWINKDEIPDNGIDDDGNGYIDDVYGWNFCDDTPNVCSYIYDEETDSFIPDSSDDNNHGTHVAGIIAAEVDNEIGIAGIASYGRVQIMSLKIHDGSNSGNINQAVKAIKYAEMMGATICNLSWGTYSDSTSLYKTIANSSMLFCTAAGNSGSDNDVAPIYPACYDLPNVISVTVTGPSGKLAQKANFGVNTVDIAVPASEVYSTVPGGYAYMGGSSMATPHISGIAALLFTLEPNFTASNVKKLIMLGAKPVKALETKIRSGGIASLYNTLEATLSPLPVDEIPPTFTISKDYSSDGVEITIYPEDEGGSGISAVRYFIGERSVEDFQGGTSGLLFDDANHITIQKSGKYTFYAVDGDGNETIKTYLVTTDTLAPVIQNLNYSIASDYSSYTISGSIYDHQSGIKSLKYIKGLHTIEDFSEWPSTKIDFENNQFSFSVAEEGIYSILARDNNGNKSLYTVRCYARRAHSIEISRNSKTLDIDETVTLRPTVAPVFTTDSITYKSSDKSVCKVSSDGVITAVGYGTATVTARTTSGCKDTIKITVKAKESDSDDE